MVLRLRNSISGLIVWLKPYSFILPFTLPKDLRSFETSFVDAVIGQPEHGQRLMKKLPWCGLMVCRGAIGDGRRLAPEN